MQERKRHDSLRACAPDREVIDDQVLGAGEGIRRYQHSDAEVRVRMLRAAIAWTLIIREV